MIGEIFKLGRPKEEIEASNEFCERVSRDFESNVKVYQHEFETIQEDYSKIVERVKEQFAMFENLQMIYFEVETSEENFSEGGTLSDLPKGAGLERVTIKGSNPAIGGLGAGFGVGAGVVGLMTAFGTAGTGAAISSLHGAAYISSLLAAIGGGTLASGGLGMAGGMMILGGAVLLPAIAVAGFLAHDKIKSAHKKAMAQKVKARQLERDSKIYFAELDKGVRILREMNYEFRASADFFQRLMTLSIISPELGGNEDYKKILQDTAQVVKTFGLLKVLDKENKLNEKLDEEFSAAKKNFETCREHYIEFRIKISPQTLESAERIKNSKAHFLKDEEIRELFNRAIEAAQIELDVTAMKLNRYVIESYVPKFEALIKAGVTIKICYGIGEENSEENRWTNKTAAYLRKKFRGCPNFKIKRSNIHAKVFICDEKFSVVSSYNVLSKRGDIYTFGEAGLRSEDSELISVYRKEYFDF